MNLFSLHLLVVATITQVAFTVTAYNNEASQRFLEENANKPGVVTTSSGLQYKIIRTGLGQFHPHHDSPTDCHYRGTLVDGVTEFESSYDGYTGRPAFHSPKQMVKGRAEAAQMMVEGDKWEIYVPADLAYEDKGNGDVVKPGDALIYTMEIIKILGSKRMEDHVARCNIKIKSRCNEKEIKYLNKAQKKYSADDGSADIPKIDIEIERIKGISENQSDQIIDWCNRRIRILNQLRGGAKKEKSDSLSMEDRYGKYDL
jgi:hypothetical protein